jgi:protein tyrosine phosphatase (PTP) superfamily phosphohydrolase (DUF442 family)
MQFEQGIAHCLTERNVVMEIVRKINDELAIAERLTLEHLQQVAQDGFKSVLILQLIGKESRLSAEQRQAEALGLSCIYFPIEEVMNVQDAGKVLKQIDQLHKPILVYCSSAMLAAAVVLMHIAVCQGETLQQAFYRAEKLELFRIYAT